MSHEGLTTNLNRVQLAPGHVFAERYVGTNGIGTALASGRPVMIAGMEHYVEALRDFHCAAVPILHPPGAPAGGLQPHHHPSGLRRHADGLRPLGRSPDRR
ncbi:GAF domain-containing protein [Streptomyces sp. F001]|uniref:GAF domain-containing protein n=1 Tax=Streptomyces sp. F001 TaxID=1510026 RepID=UPI003208795F